jgi:hypothetical protein
MSYETRAVLMVDDAMSKGPSACLTKTSIAANDDIRDAESSMAQLEYCLYFVTGFGILASPGICTMTVRPDLDACHEVSRSSRALLALHYLNC